MYLLYASLTSFNNKDILSTFSPFKETAPELINSLASLFEEASFASVNVSIIVLSLFKFCLLN